jgi:ribonuclease III
VSKGAVKSGHGASQDFADLENRIGYIFGSHEYLREALTHASLRGAADELHYERLEFLGDRVLGLAIADILHRTFADATEGELSVRFNLLVNGKTLAQISDELGLYEFIRAAGDIRELTGKRMLGVRADVLEALIAAIYLDGGLEAATDFVSRFWSQRLHQETAAQRDSKTELQEWAHANQHGTPQYVEIGRTGPDHEPVFTVVVRLEGCAESRGRGRSKRAAEQDAASALLVREGVRAGESGGPE